MTMFLQALHELSLMCPCGGLWAFYCPVGPNYAEENQPKTLHFLKKLINYNNSKQSFLFWAYKTLKTMCIEHIC